MAYKRVGFFFELSDAEQRSELYRLRRSAASPDQAKILQYLASGKDAGVSMILERDMLNEPPKMLGEALLKSDGEWLWPTSLAYFVAAYHIDLPFDFLERMRSLDWRVPEGVELVSQIPDGEIEM